MTKVTPCAEGTANSEHALNGNCWEISHDCTTCGLGTFCDVCHEHDEPRGECSECSDCSACAAR